MRMFQARQDFKISEEDGSNSRDVSVQLNVNESGLDTDNILEFLGHPNSLWGQGGRIFCKQE